MIGQLEHLAMRMASPDVTVQVLPYTAGAAPTNLPFTLLSLNGAPHGVYTETPTSGGQVDGTTNAVSTAVSDSKDPDGPHLALTREAFAGLVEFAKKHG